ncbi:MAG: RsmD family RNA methyltransferase [Mariprofundales bacterium]|nr:RsmD family RNA methyltransferase [Mariprofundales bacterium]
MADDRVSIGMRITAGELRGRRVVHARRNRVVRPTTARVREALFNIVGTLHGATVLDCFSGSGVMALEALSRGAGSVVSIEEQRQAVRSMQALSREWGLTARWRIRQMELTCALPQFEGSHFSLIFADPPYRSGWLQRLPQLLIEHRVTADYLVIEESSAESVAWSAPVIHLSSRRYGESTLHFLQLQQGGIDEDCCLSGDF